MCRHFITMEVHLPMPIVVIKRSGVRDQNCWLKPLAVLWPVGRAVRGHLGGVHELLVRNVKSLQPELNAVSASRAHHYVSFLHLCGHLWVVHRRLFFSSQTGRLPGRQNGAPQALCLQWVTGMSVLPRQRGAGWSTVGIRLFLKMIRHWSFALPSQREQQGDGTVF